MTCEPAASSPKMPMTEPSGKCCANRQNPHWETNAQKKKIYFTTLLVYHSVDFKVLFITAF